MNVHVDFARCVGHGRCYELAPEVFGEDERGYCVLKRSEIPPALEAGARAAERNCPERAIFVEPGA